MKDDPRPGDFCVIPNCDQRMIAVNGAAVCPKCDAVDEWPNVKRAEAEIVT